MQNLLIDIAATNTCRARVLYSLIETRSRFLDLQDLPHIKGGIITTQEAAQTALEAAIAEMDRRYVLFRQARVRMLGSYNAHVSTGAAATCPLDSAVMNSQSGVLTESYKQMVSSSVRRLGVMARAAGIFLIFCRAEAEIG